MQEAVKAIKDGGLVAVPTETVYGLAGNALNKDAVRKIFQVKGRPLIDPLIVHIHSMDQLEALAESNDTVKQLAEAFWPGPLTLILQKKAEKVPDLVSAGMPTVGLRMPRHPLFRKLLQEVNLPLAAPSANPFGCVSPTTAEHVKKTLGDKLSCILDGGACEIGIESTILDLTDLDTPTILRPGPITAEELGLVLGKNPKIAQGVRLSTHAQPAPGLLEQHYSPKTHLELIEIGKVLSPNRAAAVIRLSKPSECDKNTYWLSESGELDEVARNMYALLQKLDGQEYEKIYMECPPNEGIGIALRNRLKRAATK